MNTPKNTLNTIKYIASCFFSALFVFFLFRLALFLINSKEFKQIIFNDNNLSIIIKAFHTGIRFDTVIICYILALPLLIYISSFFINYKNKTIFKVLHYYIFILFGISFLISAIDIQYFQQFFYRFNINAFNWMNSPMFVFKMILQDGFNIVLLLVFIALLFGYNYTIKRFLEHFILYPKKEFKLSNYLKILISILLVVLCLFGIRGRLATKSPIRVGTAYISNYPIVNQLGLNPTFTLIKSIEEKKKNKKHEIQLIDKTKAQEFVKSEFESMYNNPVAQRDSVLNQKTNVVLVIMESMGTFNIGEFSGGNLTPNLDQIAKNSVSYTNTYSAGIHTYNGVFSTLFGQPAYLGKHSMHYTVIPEMQGGLPSVLKEKGYSTTYYTTHDDQFDNIGGFLSANGIQTIVSEHDFPSSEVKSTLGVPDHVLFNRILEDINTKKLDKPFFKVVLTGSNHTPYVIPDDIPFKAKSKNIKTQIVEYSDWAIGQFIEQAKKTDWFNNTLFVFIADHGGINGKSKYEIPLSYHHSPMFFYHPKLNPKKDHSIGLQIDIPAMICSYLGIENKNTLGIAFDIYPRKYAYFSADDKIGVIDEKYLYVWNKNGKEFLYKLDSDSNKNYIISDSIIANQMKKYAFSMISN